MFKRFRKGNQRSALTQGNIISVAIQLYRVQGNPLFLASFLGHLWLTLTILGVTIGFFFVLLIGGIFSVFTIGAGNPQVAVFGIGLLLASLIALPLLAYGFSRFHACGGLLSRQVFWRLRQETENLEAARAATYPRLWVFGLSLVWASLLTTLLYLVIGAVGYGAYVLWERLLWLPSLVIDINSPWGFTLRLATILVLLLVVLILLLVSILLTVRLSFTEVVLAIEPPMSAWQAVVRSWQLTQKQTLHSVMVLVIGSLVAWPGSVLAGLLNSITFVPAAGFLFNVLLFPYWQGIKAILYYDLRCRNEGLNFDLASSIPSPRGYLQRVTVQTPESVELDFALAGIGSRSFAWLIDQILMWLGLALFTLLGGYLYAFAILPSLSNVWDTDQINLWAASIYFFLIFVISNGYFIIFETLWQGQTPGKRFAEIRVVRDSGQPIRMTEATLRSLIKPIEIAVFFVGIILMVFTKSEKRLGDLAAGTLVIQDETLSPATTAPVASEVSEASKAFAQQLLTNQYLSNIGPDQYLTLRDFLNQRHQLSPRVRVQTATKLTDQLRAVVLPEQQFLSGQLSDEEFLQAVYLAYRRYHRTDTSSNGNAETNEF